MRVFLLSCLAVIAIGVGAYFLLEGGLRQSSGDAFAVPRSTRVSQDDKPDPRGFLSHVHSPAGGVTSGRSQTGGPPPGAAQTTGAAAPANRATP